MHTSYLIYGSINENSAKQICIVFSARWRLLCFHWLSLLDLCLLLLVVIWVEEPAQDKLATVRNLLNKIYQYLKKSIYIDQNKIYLIFNFIFNFVVTPRNFIIAKLSIRKPGSSSVLIKFKKKLCDNKITWCNYKVKYNIFSPCKLSRNI